MWLFYFCAIMSTFDQLFFGVLNHYKSRKYKHANTVALWYISIVQSAVILLIGVFFSEFFKQMKVTMFSSTKAWTLFVLLSVGILFKNWIQYSGRKLTIRNAKKSSSKSVQRSIYVLWFIPIGITGLAIILLKIL